MDFVDSIKLCSKDRNVWKYFNGFASQFQTGDQTLMGSWAEKLPGKLT